MTRRRSMAMGALALLALLLCGGCWQQRLALCEDALARRRTVERLEARQDVALLGAARADVQSYCWPQAH